MESSAKVRRFESFSPRETEKIAADFAKNAMAGDIFCLSGNLGAGKTVFAQGFAKGLGYKGRVTSPTFTIVNEYDGGRFSLYHFDLYRLNGAEDLESIGYEEYFFGGGICLVEWHERAAELFSADTKNIFCVKIESDLSRGDDFREIHCKMPGSADGEQHENIGG